nr:MAG TPA: head closure knob [Caudoviricetes sp.]
MAGATRFIRLRAKRKANPYNPAQNEPDWSVPPDELVIMGALASSSSMRTPDTLDTQTASTAYLTIPDPTADVRIGDRIRADPDDGRLWEVDGFPSKDANAFTGWRPTLECRLTERKG